MVRMVTRPRRVNGEAFALPCCYSVSHDNGTPSECSNKNLSSPSLAGSLSLSTRSHSVPHAFTLGKLQIQHSPRLIQPYLIIRDLHNAQTQDSGGELGQWQQGVIYLQSCCSRSSVHPLTRQVPQREQVPSSSRISRQKVSQGSPRVSPTNALPIDFKQLTK